MDTQPRGRRRDAAFGRLETTPSPRQRQRLRWNRTRKGELPGDRLWVAAAGEAGEGLVPNDVSHGGPWRHIPATWGQTAPDEGASRRATEEGPAAGPAAGPWRAGWERARGVVGMAWAGARRGCVVLP